MVEELGPVQVDLLELYHEMVFLESALAVDEVPVDAHEVLVVLVD